MSDRLTVLSKYLSWALRHKPEAAGLALDDSGFADANAVWSAVTARFGDRFVWDDLVALTELGPDGKRRFELADGRLRALYGHNRGVRAVHYPAVTPPAVLFHGTQVEALAGIRAAGLQAMGRQYVHLSTTVERAATVARRRTENAIILRVLAHKAAMSGVVFHNPERLHFLARAVPPAFIEFPENE